MDNHKKTTKTKALICISIGCILILSGVFLYLTSDMHKYSQAVKLLNEEKYTDALLMFDELNDYKDSYEIAQSTRYNLAYKHFKNEEYLEAISLFSLVKDYKYASDFINTSYYNLAHQLFVNNQYDDADLYFSKIDPDADIGSPHFRTIEDASEYIIEQALNADNMITLYLGDLEDYSDENELTILLTNLAQAQQASIDWNKDDKKLIIYPVYYPGVKLVAYHRMNRTHQFTEKENDLYQKALSISEKAKSESDSLVDIEIWLNTWLCENVEYVSGNVDNYSDNMYPREWTSFGAIQDGKANCQGFADAFYLLASLCDFEVRYQFGHGEDEGHVWNAIKLNQEWYFIDVTWNNIDYSEFETSFAFFNYTDKTFDISEYYEYREIADIAEEINPTYDYYASNQCTFDSLSNAAQYAINQRLAYGKKVVHLKVNHPNLIPDDFVKFLKEELKEYNGSFMIHASYLKDDTCFIVYWKSLYK